MPAACRRRVLFGIGRNGWKSGLQQHQEVPVLEHTTVCRSMIYQICIKPGGARWFVANVKSLRWHLSWHAQQPRGVKATEIVTSCPRDSTCRQRASFCSLQHS